MRKNLRLFMTALLCAVLGTASAVTVTDVLTRDVTGVTTSNTYTDWSGKQVASDAVYAGQSAGGNNAIQLRSNNSNSGIITTASGGKLKSVTVTWEGNTADGRTLNIYGSNTAYTSPTQLYGNDSGTLLGTIEKGEGKSTTLEIEGDYTFIGLRSASGAMYLTSISIVWNSSTSGKPVPNMSFSPTSISVVLGDDVVAPTLTYEGDGTITYSSSDESVATVISSTGEVDVVGAGEVIITATAAETSNWRSTSASYTISVAAKLTPTMKFTPNYINYFLGDTFTDPELTYDGDGTVTYASDNEEVATVNATTGAVTVNGTGKAVITATATETANYFGANASYTINAAVQQGTHEVVDGTFDFTDATDYGSGLTPNGYTDPEHEYETDPSTWTAGNVALVASGKYRWWLNATGNTLRFYNNLVDNEQNSKMTISVPDGYVITNIAITGGQQFVSDDNKYTKSNGKWEGEAQSVTLRYAATSGNVAVKTVTVTYKSNTTPPDPGLTVCDNIAAFKALESGTEAELKLVNAEVLYAKGRDVYVHDESGAIEFYNLGLNLDNNQVLNGSIIGKFSPYHNLPEIVKTDNTNADNLTIVEASDAEPIELTLAEAQDMQYVCELVSFDNVDIVEADGSFSLSDGQNTLALYNKFTIDLAATNNIKVAGILVIYDETYQLYPTTVDYGELPDPELAWSVETLEVVLGEDFTQPTLSAAQGFDLSTVTYNSSNASVAKMEEGALVIVGPGTAVITATAGVTTFAAGSASFTVIVTRPTPVASGKYMLVTDASTLAAGDKVIIVGTDTPKVDEGVEPVTNYYALGTNQKSNNREAVSVTRNADGTITGNSDVAEITLEEGWYFSVNGGYLYAAGTGKNYLRTEEEKDDNAKATITIEDGLATIIFQGENTNNEMRFNYNSGTPLFACYASTNTNMPLTSIYRKMDSNFLLGDANDDGQVNVTDVTVIVNYVLTKDATFINLRNANMNNDFKEDGTPDINITDVTFLVNLILEAGGSH